MSAAKSQTVLMAEDDENDVFFLERAFKQANITKSLQRVRDGVDAIAYLQGEGEYANRAEHPLPFMMLLDLKMPRKNGFEVLAWVREQPGLRRLPIVILTSSREEPDIHRAYELGANTYLVKPAKFESLVEMMRALNQYWITLAEKPSLED